MIIAICDDKQEDITTLSAMLSGYMEKTGAALLQNEFTCADDLLRALESGVRFDVIFLDVLMPGVSGIQAARELRRTDSATELIFLTIAPDFALDAFAVKARDYLVKPLHEDTLFRLMDELSARLDENDTIVIDSSSGLRKLRADRVEYCEALGRKVSWHLRSGTVLESGEGIQRAEDTLSQSGLFLRVHRAFLVNMNCIASFDRASYTIRLESMTGIPVPKAKFTELQQQYISRTKGGQDA